MTDHRFEGIVEVVEAKGHAEANHYLRAKYTLLTIQQGSRARLPRSTAEQFAVIKFMYYILGRTEAIAHAEAPPPPAPAQPTR